MSLNNYVEKVSAEFDNDLDHLNNTSYSKCPKISNTLFHTFFWGLNFAFDAFVSWNT